ncbi:hypothetical protein PZB75_03615 [Streptomyces sp. AM 4-1-1]|uniref:hypothetical protein n=1 Tax=Streptomyces sp. AM 4-1-1 TaxID=3028710 RepID=UPI0023B9265E|nr:hypothetical protein [Streptomyces sp. AM 4-1-1]WEH32548.1 hypothetical protein PZB75_03615 [Streptomyces sp. AM 4-1-1]
MRRAVTCACTAVRAAGAEGRADASGAGAVAKATDAAPVARLAGGLAEAPGARSERVPRTGGARGGVPGP